jgi:mannose-6-phosphate isomerase-like protein (cupin superfamily)
MLIEIIKPDFEFEDERGIIKQLVKSGYSQINVIYSNEGAFRGGHYHKKNREAFFVISGSFILEAMQGGEKEEHLMKTGDMFIVPLEVIHSFTFKEPSVLISMYDKGVEEESGEKDIIRV